MSSARTLLVSWKWNDLDKPAANRLQICPVSSPDRDRLVRIHQDWGNDGIIHWLSDDQKQNQDAQAEYILLLHSSYFSQDDINQLKALAAAMPCQNEILHFGKGNGFIYYNPKTDSGLLDHEGNFADAFDKDILIHDQAGNINLPYFYKVWRHYRYRLKRQFDNMRTHSHRFLHPAVDSLGYSGTAVDLLRQHKPQHFETIKDLFELLHKHYDDEPEALHQAQQLSQTLHEKHLTSGADLIEITAQFDELLAAIQEHDY